MTRRSPSQYNWSALQFDETMLTRHYTARASRTIRRVYVHHMTILGNGRGRALDACYRTWQTRQASAHYGVDGGLVRQFVRDKDNAWHAGQAAANNEGIGIEHANSSGDPSWKVSELTWKTGARLTGYIHRKHGLGRPSRATVRMHRDVRATLCPGPYMSSILSRYIAEARRVYDGGSTPSSSSGGVSATTSTKGVLGMTNYRYKRRSKDVRLNKGGPRVVPIDDKGNASLYTPGKSDTTFVATFDVTVEGLAPGRRVRARVVHVTGSKVNGAGGWVDITQAAPGQQAAGQVVHAATIKKGRRLRLQVDPLGQDVTIKNIYSRGLHG